MAEHQLTHIATSKTNPIEYAGNAVQINDWKKVVNSDCDAIIIASPPYTHREILEECIDVGKPTIVEKPMCVYYSDAKNIHEKIISKNVPVLVNHIHLWNPRHELLKILIEKNNFNPTFAYSEGGNWGPFRNDTPATYDWLPHDFALLLDTLGPIESLKSNFSKNNDIISISTKHKNGTNGWIHSGRMLPTKRRIFYVNNEKNKIEWNDNDSYVTNNEKLFPIKNDISPMENMIKYFVDAINGKDQNRMGIKLAVDVIKHIEQTITHGVFQ